jgi:peptidyl-prolyl cis-trans isomerase D
MRSYRYSLLLLLTLLVSTLDMTAQRGRNRGRTATTGSASAPVATINGEPIPAGQYHDAVADHERFQRRAGTRAVVDELIADTIMLGLVDDELVRQEAARRRMAVSRDEALKILLKDPPEFMRAPFVDSRGTFRRDVFEMVIRDPSQIVRVLDASVERDSLVRQWKADLEKVILYVQSRENRKRVTDALVAEKPLDEKTIRNRYFAEKTKIVGSFVRVLHSTIEDSLVPISMVEARAWYDAHKKDYWAAPARLIGAVVLPIEPTAADSAAHRARLDSIRTAIAAKALSARSSTVAEIQRSLAPDRFGGDPVAPSQMTAEMIRQLAPAKPGDVVGPFAQQSESTLLFVEKRTPSKDTVLRARHILLRVAPGDTASETSARELIKVLRDSIDDEKEFIEGVTYFSTDNSVQQEGDLGYFGRGRMSRAFDSAAFAGAPGTVIGPVRTEHGYHLIWVTERITEAFTLRELRVPITVSDAARASVVRDAEALATAFRTGVGVDSLVAVYRRRYPMMATDTTYVKRLERYGDILAPARFAFDAKPGDVAVLPLPFDRLMVVRVNSVWSGGTPEFEKIPAYPMAHARRARQLDVLAPRMKEIADKITPEMLIGPLRVLAPMAEVFLLNDRTANAPPDEEETILDSLVATVPRQSVGGPVRGRHGYYFLRVLEKTGPSDADYRRDNGAFAESYRQRYRTELLTKLIADLRGHATFVDLRTAEAK